MRNNKFIQSNNSTTRHVYYPATNSSNLDAPFSFGAVHSAVEKYLSADTNCVGIAKYLITNFCKTRNCVAVRV